MLLFYDWGWCSYYVYVVPTCNYLTCIVVSEEEPVAQPRSPGYTPLNLFVFIAFSCFSLIVKLMCDRIIRQPGFNLPRQQWSLLNHFAHIRDTAVPVEGNGDLQARSWFMTCIREEEEEEVKHNCKVNSRLSCSNVVLINLFKSPILQGCGYDFKVGGATFRANFSHIILAPGFPPAILQWMMRKVESDPESVSWTRSPAKVNQTL